MPEKCPPGSPLGNISIQAYLPLSFDALPANATGALQTAVLLAGQVVSESNDVLPGRTLDVVLIDTKASASEALFKAIDTVATPLRGDNSSESTLVGIVGPVVQESASTIQYIAAAFQLPQILFSVSAGRLSNVDQFPTLLRTSPSDASWARATVDLCVKFGWNEIAVLSSRDAAGVESAGALAEIARASGVQVVAVSQIPLAVSTGEEWRLVFEVMAVTGAKVWVETRTSLANGEVLRAREWAERLGYLGPDRVWLSMTSLWTLNLLSAPGLLDGGMGPASPAAVEKVRLPPNLTATKVLNSFYGTLGVEPRILPTPFARLLARMVYGPGGDTADHLRMLDPNALLAADAVLAFGWALDSMVRDGYACYITGPQRNGTLLLDYLNRISFVAASGPLQLETGAARDMPFNYLNYRPKMGGSISPNVLLLRPLVPSSPSPAAAMGPMGRRLRSHHAPPLPTAPRGGQGTQQPSLPLHRFRPRGLEAWPPVIVGGAFEFPAGLALLDRQGTSRDLGPLSPPPRAAVGVPPLLQPGRALLQAPGSAAASAPPSPVGSPPGPMPLQVDLSYNLSIGVFGNWTAGSGAQLALGKGPSEPGAPVSGAYVLWRDGSTTPPSGPPSDGISDGGGGISPQATAAVAVPTAIAGVALLVAAFLWWNLSRRRGRVDWLIDPQELQVNPQHVLGVGSYGTVYVGRYRGARVAVKVVDLFPKEAAAAAQRLRHRSGPGAGGEGAGSDSSPGTTTTGGSGGSFLGGVTGVGGGVGSPGAVSSLAALTGRGARPEAPGSGRRDRERRHSVPLPHSDRSSDEAASFASSPSARSGGGTTATNVAASPVGPGAGVPESGPSDQEQGRARKGLRRWIGSKLARFLTWPLGVPLYVRGRSTPSVPEPPRSNESRPQLSPSTRDQQPTGHHSPGTGSQAAAARLSPSPESSSPLAARAEGQGSPESARFFHSSQRHRSTLDVIVEMSVPGTGHVTPVSSSPPRQLGPEPVPATVVLGAPPVIPVLVSAVEAAPTSQRALGATTAQDTVLRASIDSARLQPSASQAEGFERFGGIDAAAVAQRLPLSWNSGSSTAVTAAGSTPSLASLPESDLSPPGPQGLLAEVRTTSAEREREREQERLGGRGAPRAALALGSPFPLSTEPQGQGVEPASPSRMGSGPTSPARPFRGSSKGLFGFPSASPTDAFGRQTSPEGSVAPSTPATPTLLSSAHPHPLPPGTNLNVGAFPTVTAQALGAGAAAGETGEKRVTSPRMRSRSRLVSQDQAGEAPAPVQAAAEVQAQGSSVWSASSPQPPKERLPLRSSLKGGRERGSSGPPGSESGTALQWPQTTSEIARGQSTRSVSWAPALDYGPEAPRSLDPVRRPRPTAPPVLGDPRRMAATPSESWAGQVAAPRGSQRVAPGFRDASSGASSGSPVATAANTAAAAAPSPSQLFALPAIAEPELSPGLAPIPPSEAAQGQIQAQRPRPSPRPGLPAAGESPTSATDLAVVYDSNDSFIPILEASQIVSPKSSESSADQPGHRRRRFHLWKGHGLITGLSISRHLPRQLSRWLSGRMQFDTENTSLVTVDGAEAGAEGTPTGAGATPPRALPTASSGAEGVAAAPAAPPRTASGAAVSSTRSQTGRGPDQPSRMFSRGDWSTGSGLLGLNVTSARGGMLNRELTLLHTLRHPRLLTFMGATILGRGMERKLVIVTELCEGGSLHQVLRNPVFPLEVDVKVRMCRETAQALMFLHLQRPPVLHLDVKPGNILLDDKFSVKLADLGLAQTVEDIRRARRRRGQATQPAQPQPAGAPGSHPGPSSPMGSRAAGASPVRGASAASAGSRSPWPSGTSIGVARASRMQNTAGAEAATPRPVTVAGVASGDAGDADGAALPSPSSLAQRRDASFDVGVGPPAFPGNSQESSSASGQTHGEQSGAPAPAEALASMVSVSQLQTESSVSPSVLMGSQYMQWEGADGSALESAGQVPGDAGTGRRAFGTDVTEGRVPGPEAPPMDMQRRAPGPLSPTGGPGLGRLDPQPGFPLLPGGGLETQAQAQQAQQVLPAGMVPMERLAEPGSGGEFGGFGGFGPWPSIPGPQNFRPGPNTRSGSPTGQVGSPGRPLQPVTMATAGPSDSGRGPRSSGHGATESSQGAGSQASRASRASIPLSFRWPRLTGLRGGSGATSALASESEDLSPAGNSAGATQRGGNRSNPSLSSVRFSGTLAFASPEVLLGEMPTTASDIYSLGIAMWEVFFRRNPYPDLSRADIILGVSKGTLRPHLDRSLPGLPASVADLIEECWSKNPIRRPTVGEVCNRLEAIERGPEVRTILAETRRREDGNQQRKAESERRDRVLLLKMLPEKVAAALSEGRKVEPDHVESCTVFFSDIVGFTRLAERLTATGTMELLNRLYAKFDQLTLRHGLFKVETIGDSFMVAGGLHEVQPDHVLRVCRFALDAREAARAVLVDPSDPSLGHVRVRMGFHTGPVVASVVGDLNPRYCLFGDTINTASRMESHSVAQGIQMSPTAYGALQIALKKGDLGPVASFEELGLSITRRGKVPIKGKGILTTFWLERFGEAPLREEGMPAHST